MPVAGSATTDPGPESAVIAAADSAALRRAFSRLDDRERELLELRVVARLSAREVATVLHKRPTSSSSGTRPMRPCWRPPSPASSPASGALLKR